MAKKNWGKVLLGFSMVLVAFSVIFFIYTKFNLKYSKKLTAENETLVSKIELANKNVKDLRKELSDTEVILNKKSIDFYENYGYQFGGDKNEEVNKILSDLQTENDELLSNMTKLIKDNSKYFESNIYSNELYDKSVDLFFNLSSENNIEKNKNIYKELSVDELIRESDGFVSKIKNSNKESKELNSLIYYLSIYGFKIDDFTKGSYKSLADVYSDINTYSEILSEIEKLGYSTGGLNSKDFNTVKDNFKEYLVPFYKNRGLIVSLEKGDKK